MTKIEEIKENYKIDGDAPAAIKAYSEVIADANLDDPLLKALAEEALVERGLLFWKMGDRAAAINDYNEAIRLNPASRAVQVKQATYDILDFYHKDLFNP